MQKEDYESYAEYLEHQKAGRLDPKKLAWVKGRRQERVSMFAAMFRAVGMPASSECLCIGARFGEEVEAGRECFKSCIGIDLIAFPPLVVEGDMHDIMIQALQTRLGLDLSPWIDREPGDHPGQGSTVVADEATSSPEEVHSVALSPSPAGSPTEPVDAPPSGPTVPRVLILTPVKQRWKMLFSTISSLPPKKTAPLLASNRWKMFP